MKRILLSVLVIAWSILCTAQTATLRLEVIQDSPQPGEKVNLGIWLDALSYDPPGIRSAQVFLEFDEKVLTPVEKDSIYHTGVHPILLQNEMIVRSNVPFPGDIRFILFTTDHTGIEFGSDIIFPIKLWETTFVYLGGKTDIKWGRKNILEPVPGEEHGGILKKGATLVYAIDNSEYQLQLTGASVGKER